MASYTPNYGLHQWVPEDVFVRTDFNTDLAKIDEAIQEAYDLAESKERIVFGSYTGDEEPHRTINLGFTIKWIFVYPADGDPRSYNSGLAAPGFPPPVDPQYVPHLSVVGTTIQVGFGGNTSTNYPTKKYYYIAGKA